MPDLPTLTVTQAQADRITAAFGDVPTYRAWLREQVKAFVIAKETGAIRDAAEVEADAKTEEIRTDLGTI